MVEGLAREVHEETGLVVTRWAGPLYEIEAHAPDMGWPLRVEAWRAAEWEGEIEIDDPDGIVEEARWVPSGDCVGHLDGGSPWVAEPVGEWLADAVDRPAQLRVPRRRHRAVVARRHPGVSAIGPGAERPEDRATATILHVDMDAFFVSVELLDRPELRGQPVVVGGDGDRGVVAAASYEARAYGVHSAMPSVRARRLCPQAVFLAGRHGRYAEVSAPGHGDLPRRHPAGRAAVARRGVPRRHRRRAPARAGAADRRPHPRRVLAEEGLTCSVGVAATKFVAKLASEAAKPRPRPTGPRPGPGWRWSSRPTSWRFLHPLPVQALWGVGPGDPASSSASGVATVGDLADLPEGALVAALGRSQGRHLHALAHGHRPPAGRAGPEGQVDRPRGDLRPRPPSALAPSNGSWCGFADAVAPGCGPRAWPGARCTLKVRFGDFRTITRSSTLAVAVDDGPVAAARGQGPARPGRSRARACACSGCR